MKKIIIFLIIIPQLISCQNKKNLDRSDINSIQEFLITSIKEKDTIAFLKLFDFQLNPQYTDSIALRNLNLKSFNEAHRILKDKSIKYVKYDKIAGLNGGELIDNESLNIYIKAEENYYKLRLTHHTINSEGGNYFLLFYFHNLTSECNDISNKPYKPSLLFTHLNWDTLNGYVFDYATVVFDNLTEYDIDKIKFRLTIENEEKILFHQTIISNEKIYKGDINGVNIHQLSGVNAGFKLKKEKFNWNVEVLEVFPIPIHNPCAKIEELKKK